MQEYIDTKDIFIDTIGKTVHQIILDLSSDPIFAFDATGKYLYVNNAFAKPFNKIPADIINQRIWDVFPKEQADKRFAAVKRAFETGEEVAIEVKVDQEKDPLYFITTVTPVKDQSGQVQVVICISKNITSRIEMEQKLQTAKQITENKNTELDRMVTELYDKSIRDSLTHLFNRHHGLHLLENEIQKSKSQHIPLSLLMIDIDHFKEVNDTYGHLVGDEVLLEMTHIFARFFQEKGFVARYGGEEFIVILPFINKEQAVQIAEELRIMIEGQRWSGFELKCAISIGVTTFANESIKDFVRRADDMLYLAKDKGRNRVESD